MNVDHVVVFRLGSLGDTVVSLPCWNRIAARFQHSRRTLLTNIGGSAKVVGVPAVLEGSGFIHDLIEYPIGLRSPRRLFELARTLRTLNADTLLYMAEPRGAASVYRDWAFFRACGFRNIIGLPWRKDERENRIDPVTGVVEYEALRLTRQMSELGPFDLDDPAAWDLRLSAAEIAQGEAVTASFGNASFIGVNLGGKDAHKDWGQTNWEELIARLSAALPGTGLLTVGALADSARSQALARLWSGPFVNGCGMLSVRVCAAALTRASLLIGHDSGPLHLGAARGVACIGLFGAGNRPIKWHPYGARHRILHRLEGMSAISVQEVFDTATALWHEERAVVERV